MVMWFASVRRKARRRHNVLVVGLEAVSSLCPLLFLDFFVLAAPA